MIIGVIIGKDKKSIKYFNKKLTYYNKYFIIYILKDEKL